MARLSRNAEVEWEGTIARGMGRIRGGSGALPSLPVTIASRLGADGGMTTPEELIAAAHAGCFTMALGSILARRGLPPEQLKTRVTCSLDEVDGRHTLVRSEIEARGRVPGADAASFEEAAREAQANCVISRALHGNVEIELAVVELENEAS